MDNFYILKSITLNSVKKDHYEILQIVYTI
jgi:hypothetical protein